MISPYYRRLREAIGNDVLLIPGVAAVIHDDRGRLLLQKKQDGTWSLPAGAIEETRYLEYFTREDFPGLELPYDIELLYSRHKE